MSNALVTMPTVAADDGIEAEHHNNVAANIRSLSRNFWDAGTPDLALSEQKQGTSWVDPTTLAMWIFRIDGAGDPRDAGSPLRPTWHWNDFEGEPPDDGRVAEGDFLIWDSGEGDRYLMAARFTGDVPAPYEWFGLSMLAQYRTAATDGAPAQHSDHATWRASSWAGLEAEDREFLARCFVRSAAEASDIWEWRLSRLAAGGTERDVVRITSDGELRVQGPGSGQPGLLILDTDLDNVHATSQVGGISCTSFAPDQAQMVLVHGTAARRLSWQFRCPTDGFLGLDALAVQLSPAIPADEGSPYLPSPTAAFTASYLTEGGVTGATWWAQHQMDSADPTGRLRFANTYGDGVLDLHHYGRLALAGTKALTGSLADGDAAQTTLTPTYDGAHTVTRHSYRKLANPTLTGSAALIDACRDHYDAAAGTHKAVDAATGGADAWEKANVAGTVMYGPLFAAKDLGIPTPVYGEIYFSGGLVTSSSVAQTLTTAATPQKLTGFDTDGSESGCTCDAANDKITIDTTAIYRVSATVCLSGDAGSYLIGLIEANGGTPVNQGRTIEFTLAASESKAVSLCEIVTLTAGNDIEVWGFNVVDNGADIAIHDLILSIERVA